jgi:hypothetical protein
MFLELKESITQKEDDSHSKQIKESCSRKTCHDHSSSILLAAIMHL